MHDPASSRDKSKSPNNALAYRLLHEVGLNPAQARVTLDLLADHLQTYYGDQRPPGVVIHTAVSKSEPAGKPIKDCKLVPVRLTYFHEADFEVQREQGTVEMRATRLYRLCCEAQQQGALLSYEDLHNLLCTDVSTVKDLVGRLRAQGLMVPTRGAVHDIGPEPSHKRIIATMLGSGRSTSQIRAATKHSEHSIARYQLDFAMVLYLLHHYKDASRDDLRLLSGLSDKAFETYVEVAKELAERPECQRHLERLRRRYELDPKGLAHKVPDGKRPQDLSRRRLEQQNLDTALRQTIEVDLGTTSRVAQAVASDLGDLIDKAFVLTDHARPGEVAVFVDAHDPSLLSGEKANDRKVIAVTVPLHTEQAKEIWRSDEPKGRRRARIAAHVATAAHEQGGVMTMAGLAELLHTTPATMSKDLRELAVQLHVEAPTKGLIEDAGPTLTHKEWIVDLDDYGLTGEEISWLTRHAPASRDRYIETYRRAETLMQLEGCIPTPEHLARVLRLPRHVAWQYTDLLEKHHGGGKCPPDIAGTASCTTAPAPQS